MDTGEIVAVTGALVAAVGLFLNAVVVWVGVGQLRLERKLRTIEFVSGQFNRLADAGIRAQLRDASPSQRSGG